MLLSSILDLKILDWLLFDFLNTFVWFNYACSVIYYYHE
jgi:hypothetical protein